MFVKLERSRVDLDLTQYLVHADAALSYRVGSNFYFLRFCDGYSLSLRLLARINGGLELERASSGGSDGPRMACGEPAPAKDSFAKYHPIRSYYN